MVTDWRGEVFRHAYIHTCWKRSLNAARHITKVWREYLNILSPFEDQMRLHTNRIASVCLAMAVANANLIVLSLVGQCLPSLTAATQSDFFFDVRKYF